jgi:hypothetical protein
MSITLDCISGLFMRRGQNLNYILTVAALVARNTNFGYCGACGEFCVWQCLEPGSRFFVGTFRINLSSAAIKMFSPLIYLTMDNVEKFCKFNNTP